MGTMAAHFCLIWLTMAVAWGGIARAASPWGERKWQEHCESVRTSYNRDEVLRSDALTLSIYDPRWEDFVFWAIINGVANRKIEGPDYSGIFRATRGSGITLRWAPGTRWERVRRYSYGYAIGLLVGEHGWRDVQFVDYFAGRGGTYDYNLKDRLYLLDPAGSEPWDEFLTALANPESRYSGSALAQPVLADLTRESVVYRGGQGVAYEVGYKRFLADLKEVLTDCRAYEFFQDYDTYGQGFASRPGWAGQRVSPAAGAAFGAAGNLPSELAGAGTAQSGALPSPPAGPGAGIYAEQCAVCHGSRGQGDGLMAAAIKPPPRDFGSRFFKIRSSPSGEPPTEVDLVNVVTNGLPGTAMPAWSQFLSPEEIQDVVSYLKSLSSYLAGPEPPSLPAKEPVLVSGETLLKGARQWRRLGCGECHGKGGCGYGPKAFELKDAAGQSILPTDLTNKWQFRGGYSPQAIYWRLAAGMDGTPMGSYLDRATEQDLWDLVFYVLDLSPPARPIIRKRASDMPP